MCCIGTSDHLNIFSLNSMNRQPFLKNPILNAIFILALEPLDIHGILSNIENKYYRFVEDSD